MMISESFSSSRQVVEFIYEQRASDSFARQELLTRIVGVSLSVFVLFDFCVHAVGAVESTFYAVYTGVIERKPIDFSLPEKHLKCLKLFMCTFITASSIGLIYPDIKAFALLESATIGALRGLLLSRNEKHYTNNHHINEESLIEYIQTLTENLDYEKKEGMDDTLQLLEKTKEIEKLIRHQSWNKALNISLSHFLRNAISSLQQKDGTLFDRIIFKEILARLLALGLSVTAVIDFFIRLCFVFCFIEVPLIDAAYGGKLFNGEMNEIILCFLYLLRDTLLFGVGAMAGSVVGIVSPELGAHISDPSSDFYDNIRISDKDVLREILDSVTSLEDGKSVLLPITLPYGVRLGDSAHFITLLVSKENDNYSLSMLNKGAGADSSNNGIQKRGAVLPEEKTANLTLTQVSYESLEKYLTSLISTINLSSGELWDIGEDEFEKTIKDYCKMTEDYHEMKTLTEKLETLALKHESDIGKELIEKNKPLIEILKKSTDLYHQMKSLSEDEKEEFIGINIKKYILEKSLEIFLTNKEQLANNQEDLLIFKLQTTGDCPKASLLGGLHYHSWKKNGDSKKYKAFLSNLKQKALEQDGHLLDVSLGSALTKKKPSVAAKKRLDLAFKKIELAI